MGQLEELEFAPINCVEYANNLCFTGNLNGTIGIK